MDNFLGMIPIPIYCERGNLEGLAEPLNAISNIAFILASFGIYKLLTKYRIQKIEYKVVLILILSIGVGSFLWHATRHSYTLLLDVVPVSLSFAAITYIFLAKLIGNKLLALLLALLLIPGRFFISSFAPTDITSSLIRNLINATVFLVIIVWTFKKYGIVALEGFGILAVYLIAITMRSIDLQICPTFPVGTHFLWHIFNAFAVYLAVRFLIKLELSQLKQN